MAQRHVFRTTGIGLAILLSSTASAMTVWNQLTSDSTVPSGVSLFGLSSGAATSSGNTSLLLYKDSSAFHLPVINDQGSIPAGTAYTSPGLTAGTSAWVRGGKTNLGSVSVFSSGIQLGAATGFTFASCGYINAVNESNSDPTTAYNQMGFKMSSTACTIAKSGSYSGVVKAMMTDANNNTVSSIQTVSQRAEDY